MIVNCKLKTENSQKFKGFTLVELLISMAILAILSTLGMANFQSTRIKARDISRKADLQTIAKSLEAYVNDHHTYPLSTGNGEILCGSSTCSWGSPFTDDNGTIYATELPDDETAANYYYSSNGTSYTIYAKLENNNDSALDSTITQTCGSSELVCNYQIKSSNQL